jgi:hypothetical protein
MTLEAQKNVLTFPSASEHTLDSQLRFAIANKRLIRFTYESVVRVAEPHDYGLRDGVAKLLAYQRQKGTRRDPRARGWRWLDVSKIHDCVVLEDRFAGTREASNQHHHHWDVLYARVDYPVT